MSELQMLPAWLDAGAAALAGAVPPAPTLAGALPGLAQAQSLTPAAAAAARAGVGPRRMRRAPANRSISPGGSSCAATGLRCW